MSTGQTPDRGRGIFSIGGIAGRAPTEIRLAAALLVAGGLVFVLMDLLRMLVESGGPAQGAARPFLLPLLQLAIGIGVAGGLICGMRLARYAGMLVALTFALMHMVFALQPLPPWIRVMAGLVAASQVYVAVLLNTRPALLFTGGVRR
jgi:hypothetical protein